MLAMLTEAVEWPHVMITYHSDLQLQLAWTLGEDYCRGDLQGTPRSLKITEFKSCKFKALKVLDNEVGP